MSTWALSLGLVEIGEYEEALKLAKRAVDLARMAQDTYLLAVNLDRLGQAHEAMLNLEEARAAYEERLGQQYGPWSSARLCVVAALSENWEEAYAHAKRANEATSSSIISCSASTFTTRLRHFCGEETRGSPEKRCAISPNARRRTNGIG